MNATPLRLRNPRNALTTPNAANVPNTSHGLRAVASPDSTAARMKATGRARAHFQGSAAAYGFGAKT